MNILEELKFYCETQNPVGALMLSGEWATTFFFIIIAPSLYLFILDLVSCSNFPKFETSSIYTLSSYSIQLSLSMDLSHLTQPFT